MLLPDATAEPPVARPAPVTTPVSPRALTLAALLSAVAVGVAMAARVPAGIALLIAAGYVPLLLIDLRLGIAIWTPLIFLEGIPALNLAGKAAGLLIVAAWLGTLRGERARIAAVVRSHVRMLVVLALFLVWLTLSLGWATKSSAGAKDLWHWWAVAILFAIVATSATTRGGVRAVAFAFVVGAALSVIIGLVAGGIVTNHSVNPVTGGDASGGRLAGTEGDPNFLAAGLIPAALIAAGLIPGTRKVLLRWLLIIAIGVMVGGIVASESRGGGIAALVVVLAAFAFFRGRRRWVLAFVLLSAGVATAWFVASPSAWQRVTAIQADQGSGRTDEWTVAWRAGSGHPVVGVGLNNFQQIAGQYVRQPGLMTHVNVLVDQPHFVHNVYLQFFAETGIVGLGLFLAFVATCLTAMWRAARRFEAARDGPMTALAESVLVGMIGMLAASTFISDGNDQRLWLLLALGPALLAVASQTRAGVRQRA
jgi:O-antigen ligase